MVGPLALSLGLTAASGLANKLFGGSEQEKFLKYLKGQLKRPDVAFGIPQGERLTLSNKFKKDRLKNLSSDIARGEASLTRRGVSDPNVLKSARVGAGNEAAEDVSDFNQNLLVEHLRQGRLKKAQLENLYGQVAGGMGDETTPASSDVAQNLMTYYLLKNKMNKQISPKTGFYSSPGLFNLKGLG